MSIDNNSNRSRVEKICILIQLIGKSAKSNRATPEEVHTLMQPVLAALGEIGFYASPKAPGALQAAERAPTPRPDGARLSISDYVADSTLCECSSAIALCMIRIDKALEEAGKI